MGNDPYDKPGQEPDILDQSPRTLAEQDPDYATYGPMERLAARALVGYDQARGRGVRKKLRKLEQKPIKPGDAKGAEAGMAEAEAAAKRFQKNREDEYGPPQARAQDLHDKLNKGFTGRGKKDDKKSIASRLYNSKPEWKKRLGIAVAVMGANVFVGLAIFFFLLPLKISTILASIEGKYLANTSQAVEQEAENVFGRYLAKDVLHAISTGNCVSTIDVRCKVTPTDCLGVWCTVYGAFRDARLERTLATKYGIVIGKSGPNYYMSSGYDRKNITISQTEFGELQSGKKSVFELEGMKPATRTQIRAMVKQEIPAKKFLKRYTIGKLLERKYGIKRCMVACTTRDRISDNTEALKLLFKMRLVQNLLGANSGLVMTCLLAGTESCKTDKPDPATASDGERVSGVQKEVQSQLDLYLEKFSENAIEDAITRAKAIEDAGGLKRYLAQQAVSKTVGAVFGDAAGASAGRAAITTVTAFSLVLIASYALSGAAHTGPMLSQAAYATNSAKAAQIYDAYAVVDAERKSGNMDAYVWSGVDEALHDGISGDPAQQGVDVMTNPDLQRILNGTGSSSSALAWLPDNLLAGTAFAAGISANTAYPCDDGQPVPASTDICPEMNFAADGLKAATTIANAANAIPIVPQTADVITKIGSQPSKWLSAGIEHLPGFSAVGKMIGKAAATPTEWLQDQVMVAPSIGSAPRQADWIIAGANVVGNETCKVSLGCQQIDDKTVAAIRNQYLADARQDFLSRPLFARIFSADTPYSLVSRVALSMPVSLSSLASSGLLNLLTNPFTKIGSVLSSVFASPAAFAGEPVKADARGITQYGYPIESIPSDPEGYWNRNCVNGPMATYNNTTHKLDVSAWLNDDTHQTYDSLRGEMVTHTTNPCLLINATIQNTGGMFNPSLLAAGAANPDQ